MYLTEQHKGPGTPAGILTEKTMTRFERVSSPSASGRMRVRGEVGRANRPTGNGRYYTESLLRREVNSLRPMIEKRGVLGEMDHPGDGRSTLNRVALVVTELVLEADGRLMAEYEVLDTTCGKNLQAILKADCLVGASIRGYGTTSMIEGVERVNDDYRLLTFDVVIDPADVDAYPTVVKESLSESNHRRNTMSEDVDLASKLEEAFREGRAVGSVDAHGPLLEEFTKRLAAAVSAARVDERVLVEQEMAGLPGALQALNAVRDAILPFVLPAQYRRVVESVEVQRSAVEAELAQVQGELVETQKVARSSTYKLYALTNVPESMRESLWKTLGDDLGSVTEEQFQRAVHNLTESVGRRAVAVEHQARGAALAAYITEVTALHPHRTALRARLQQMSPRTQAEVDQIIQKFTSASGRSASLSERIANLADGRVSRNQPQALNEEQETTES